MVTCVTVSSPSTPATLTQGCGDSIWSVSHPLFRTWCTLFRENGKLPTVSLKILFLVEEYNLKRKYLKRIFFSAWPCLGTTNASNSKLWHPMPSPSTQFLAPLLGMNSLRCRFCSLYKEPQQGFFFWPANDRNYKAVRRFLECYSLSVQCLWAASATIERVNICGWE